MKGQQNNRVHYQLKEDGSFIIDNFNASKPFSNFFPGIAGVWGTPMWVFYVNRGQCIASAGVESKDKAIMEFQPANKAYRQTALQGFRTFIKVKQGKRSPLFWEPFQENLRGTDYRKDVQMKITAHDLTLLETNHDLGLSIEVNYFTLPEEDYAALVRVVTLRNNSRQPKQLEMIDGIPVIAPYGLRDWLNKHISRTVEAWTKVRNLDKKAPYYQLNVEVSDKPEVQHIKEGNFYFSFDPNVRDAKLFQPIIEASCIFGDTTDYLCPEAFLAEKFTLPKNQQFSNRTPCAMSHSSWTLKAGEEKQIVSFLGYAHSMEQLNNVLRQASVKGFVSAKAARNKEIIDGIKGYAQTVSASSAYNLYAGHTFLDNILRGGLPISLATQKGPVAFNVFSRKHGDLERDYNFFTVAPTYFSQGNGNYRDVNQNRRNDIFFNTDVGESHLTAFLNLIQADGYNPLVVRGTSFAVSEKSKIEPLLNEFIEKSAHEAVRKFLEKPFQPGELLQFISRNGIQLKGARGKVTEKDQLKELLGAVMLISQKQEIADHGEGFWSDHWTYNLDMIESFLAVYPEKWEELLLQKKDFTFYHNAHYVLARHERFIKTPHGIRQYESVRDGTKEIRATERGSRLRTKLGEGFVYHTTLIVKLLCLLANKVATLDPSGVGVEMESDKPNWYDALNGLPGLNGSSVSETFEVKRLAQFLRESLEEMKVSSSTKISVFEELALFVEELTNALESAFEPIDYWNRSNDLKETYRAKVRQGITGDEKVLTVEAISRFLDLIIARTAKGVRAAADKEGKLRTYFYHEVAEYDESDADGHGKHHFVKPKKFKRQALPLFLEGYVHALRAETNAGEAKKLYRQVRESGLFDKKLKMYKVNDNLSSESEDIGRTRIFPRGWLENESIWLHMEYKFMLELLRRGLYEEFYENFKNVLVPFMNPQRYGRNILENSSFLASSAHEDQTVHGQGFVARLSGSTAEFLHMWLLMNAGETPFTLNNKNELVFRLAPALPREMFTQRKTQLIVDHENVRTAEELPANSYAFKFLGKTLVVYHNPGKKNAFGSQGVQPVEYRLFYADTGESQLINGPSVHGQMARDIRDGKVARIDVKLA